MRFNAEAKVGVLIIVSFAFLVYMSVQLGTLRLDGRNYYQVRLPFESVGGLNRGAGVKMAGVKIGSVDEIALEEGRVLVTVSIQRAYRVPDDVRAEIRTEGVLGEKFLELEYRLDGEPLDDGATAHVVNRATSDDLMGAFGKVADDVSDITSNLKRSLGNPQTNDNINELIYQFKELSTNLNALVVANRQSVDATMENLSDITNTLKHMIERNESQVDQTMGNLTQITEVVKGITVQNEQKINALITNLEIFSSILRDRGVGVVNELEGTLRSAGGAFGELDGILTENREDLREVTRNVNALTSKLNRASTDIQDISEKINHGDGTLGKLVNSDALHESLVGAAKGIESLTGKIEQFKTDITLRSEFLTEVSETRGTLAVRVTPPQRSRFYEIGLVSTPFGRNSRTERRTLTYDHQAAGLVSDISTIEDENKYSLEYNALFGFIPYEDLELRVGLMETTFGVGASYVLPWFGKNIRVGMEAFDFNPQSNDSKNNNTHLKFTTDYHISNAFYLTAGFDDPLNPARRSPFAGVAFTFSDENLKYLAGKIPMGN